MHPWDAGSSPPVPTSQHRGAWERCNAQATMGPRAPHGSPASDPYPPSAHHEIGNVDARKTGTRSVAIPPPREDPPRCHRTTSRGVGLRIGGGDRSTCLGLIASCMYPHALHPGGNRRGRPLRGASCTLRVSLQRFRHFRTMLGEHAKAAATCASVQSGWAPQSKIMWARWTSLWAHLREATT